MVSIHTLHELEARGVGPVWEQTLSLSFHSYASRIGSKFIAPDKDMLRFIKVSIHTLHELEASGWRMLKSRIRKVSIHTLHELEARGMTAAVFGETPRLVSIHTLHELEARPSFYGDFLWEEDGKFPFIRFTNWKQEFFWQYLYYNPLPKRFHSYASRIGSKTSFAKLGCTRIVQRFFVGYW
jgi:hypothetical protein